MTIAIIAAYAAAAVWVGLHAYLYGVGRRPREPWMTSFDYAALLITAVVVGALWMLFVPALGYQWLQRYRRQNELSPRRGGLPVRGKAAAHS